MAPKLGGPGEKCSHAVIIHYVDQVFVGSSTSFHALPCSDMIMQHAQVKMSNTTKCRSFSKYAMRSNHQNILIPLSFCPPADELAASLPAGPC